MNCSQYNYGQTPNQTQSRDMTTRPMQSGMDMNANMPMGGSSAGRTADIKTPSSADWGRGIGGQLGAPQGGWNLPSTGTQPLAMQTPTTVESPYYTAGFLRNFIGKTMRVEFLIGTTGALVDRTGELMEVGASYIVLRPAFSDDLLMCDLYAIKFVTIYT